MPTMKTLERKWQGALTAWRHHSKVAKENKVRAHRLHEALRAKRKKPDDAVRWALTKVGEHEVPSGSNRGPQITEWQRNFGSWLVGQPWCGVFLGNALRQVGVEGVNSRVAAVAYIEDDAKAGVNGFADWLGRSHTRARRGDAVILFARGVHVGIVAAVDVKAQLVYTVEGNTSPGVRGSQDNGGGVYTRTRSFYEVYGYARPRY